MKRILQIIALLSLHHAMGAVAGPISSADIVQLGDTQWAQLDLFAELSWLDMNAVCPGGVCGNGTLNGHDMAGWNWATTAELNALFNRYLEAAGVTGADLLDAVMPDRYGRPGSNSWSTAFFAEGWRAYGAGPGLNTLAGFSSDLAPGGIYANIGYVGWNPAGTSSEAMSTNANYVTHARSDNRGGWFYRAAMPVPVSSTLALLFVSISGLVMQRKRGRRDFL